MYKSKRIIAFLLSLMLIVLTFAACANKDEERYTKAELEAAIQQIGGLSDVIKKQEIELSSQLEKEKNK